MRKGRWGETHRPLCLLRRLGYGCGWPVQTLSKQIGQVMDEHARSLVAGHPVTGVGAGPSVAVAPVTRTTSVNPYLPVLASMVDGK